MAAPLAAASARFVAGGDASPARPWAATARVPCIAGRRRRPAAGVRCGGARVPAGGGFPEEAEAEEGGRFVGWFREAWPYIRGHRGSTFVVVISGEVVAGPYLDGILQVAFSNTGSWRYAFSFFDLTFYGDEMETDGAFPFMWILRRSMLLLSLFIQAFKETKKVLLLIVITPGSL
jgi:hypothetical protein